MTKCEEIIGTTELVIASYHFRGSARLRRILVVPQEEGDE